MALSLSCPCGARFEVDDTFSGQEVSCPECQAAVRAPAAPRGAVQTSDLAIASTVLALVGAFTVLGTAVAALLGVVAIVRILRNRDRLAGLGYAVFGIVAGLTFTAITLFAYSTGELFGAAEQVRKSQFAGKTDDPRDLEIVRPEDGFSITRPSHSWTVAKPQAAAELNFPRSKVLLINTSLNVYVDITVEDARWATMAKFLDLLAEVYLKEARDAKPAKDFESLRRVSDVRVRDKRVLASANGAELGELLLDLRMMNQPFTLLIRVVKDSNRFYVASAQAERKRYLQPKVEAELREVLGSLRVLGRNER